MLHRLLLFILLTTWIVSACSSDKEKKENSTHAQTPHIAYSVQRSFPHDTKSFTQGFTIHNGKLYESTGQNNSWIGIVNISTGEADKKVTLPNQYFGEGITILNNKIYQLTWQSKIGFVYNLNTFEKIKDFSYSTEGWGITHNNEHLIMSDGSDKLYFLDTVNLSVVKSLPVTYEGKVLNQLNELEYIDGFAFANVWQSNSIVKIDLTNGKVVGIMDLSDLVSQARMVNPSMDVLNGIAWHAGTKSLLVTGKYWPFIYSLKFKEANNL
jgi:glutaminyl-peptide cyclotransferase